MNNTKLIVTFIFILVLIGNTIGLKEREWAHKGNIKIPSTEFSIIGPPPK